MKLVKEEVAEELKADAKKWREKMLGKRRAISDQEAEWVRPLQHMQDQGLNPHQPSLNLRMNLRMSAKSRARRSPCHQLCNGTDDHPLAWMSEEITPNLIFASTS